MYEPEWVFPDSVSGALSILRSAGGRARVIAGGTDLAVAIKNRALLPEVLVDLGRVPELSHVKEEGGDLVIGACVTHGALAARGPSGGLDALSSACAAVGAPQIRARGTVGGNVANGSPAADAAVALMALDARVRVARIHDAKPVSEERSLSDFMLAPGETSLGEDEMVTHLVLKRPPVGTRGAYAKVGQRNALAIAIVSAAVVYDPEVGGIRIAIGSAAPTPVRATEAERLFEADWRGAKDRDALVREVARKAEEATRPISDVRATAEYRRALARALVERTVRDLCM